MIIAVFATIKGLDREALNDAVETNIQALGY